MLRTRIVTIIIIAFAVVAAGGATMLPVPQHAVTADADIQRISQGLAITAGMAVIMLGAALLFLMNLRDFRTGFQKVYYLISAGIATMALSGLLYAVLQYLTFWFEDALIFSRLIPLSAVAQIMIYLGVRRFAQILDVPAWRPTQWTLIICAVLGVALVWVLPLHATFYGQLFAAQSHGILRLANTWGALNIIFALNSVVLLWYIKAAAGPRYKRPLLWFMFALINVAIGAGIYLLTDFITPPSWFRLEFVAIPYFATYILFIISAYSFACITQRTEERQQKATLIDVIIYMASLASKQQEIDSILDGLRIVTSHDSSYKGNPGDDKAQLLDVYKRLEEYLVTKERLRVYSRESLRSQLRERFNLPPELNFPVGNE